MSEKIIIAIVAAVLSGVGTYTMKVLSIEGRLDGMERSLLRIETRLFPVAHQ